MDGLHARHDLVWRVYVAYRQTRCTMNVLSHLSHLTAVLDVRCLL